MAYRTLLPYRASRNSTIAEKLALYSMPEPNSGCVLWLASVDRFGYGHLHIEGKLRKAHRLAWQLSNGPIPARMFVCHKCDVPGCINPAHLFLGTAQTNMDDKVQKGRWRGGAVKGTWAFGPNGWFVI